MNKNINKNKKIIGIVGIGIIILAIIIGVSVGLTSKTSRPASKPIPHTSSIEIKGNNIENTFPENFIVTLGTKINEKIIKNPNFTLSLSGNLSILFESKEHLSSNIKVSFNKFTFPDSEVKFSYDDDKNDPSWDKLQPKMWINDNLAKTNKVLDIYSNKSFGAVDIASLTYDFLLSWKN